MCVHVPHSIHGCISLARHTAHMYTHLVLDVWPRQFQEARPAWVALCLGSDAVPLIKILP